jgi:glycerophosphoryl diester phosphodiesterase
VTSAARGRALRLAHRGDWRRAPENTLAAITAAVAVPACDGVEFDVRLSRDGVPVLLHDFTLARVQQVETAVGDLDAAELAGYGVPALATVLAALPPVAFLDIELKGHDHGAATATVLHAARGAAPVGAVVSSFEPSTLEAMAERLPGWTRWLNADDLHAPTIDLAVRLGCRGISVAWRAVTPVSLVRARAGGLDVAAWTVRRRATFDRLARLGVVAVCVEAAALDG